MSDQILVTTQDGVATFRLNRPNVYNAISFEMWDELVSLLLGVEYRDDVNCVVLASTGPNFSSGTDIGDLGGYVGLTPSERSETFSKRMELTNRVFMAMERIPQPVVSSVRGVAAGGGFGLAVGADMVVASETARFNVATLELGSVPDVGVPIQLARTMGIKRAKQYCMMGEAITADVALEFGLVNWVVPDGELESKTDAVAKHLAAMPRPGVSLAKAALNECNTRSLADHLRQEAVDVGRAVAHPGYVERIEAFLQRRAARGR